MISRGCRVRRPCLSRWRAVVGCADIKLTAGMWQLPSPPPPSDDDTPASVDDARNTHRRRQRQPDSVAVIRCNSTDEQWTLTCRDNSWVGQLGNCSPASATAKRETTATWRSLARSLASWPPAGERDYCHARHGTAAH